MLVKGQGGRGSKVMRAYPPAWMDGSDQLFVSPSVVLFRDLRIPVL